MRYLRSCFVLALLLSSTEIWAQSTAGSQTDTPSTGPAATPASAAPPPPAEPQTATATPAPRRTRTRERFKSPWYGWQTLIVDGGALLISIPAPEVGIGVYLAGAPLVHVVHGSPGKAFGSLVVRVLLPIAFGVGGIPVACAIDKDTKGDDSTCVAIGMILGGHVGASAAVALDAAVLARNPVESAPAVVPAASINKNGAWFGAAGQF